MSFLSSVARWAEEHVPLVGGWIARLVEKIEEGLEGAWGWIEKTVSYIKNTWIPWVETKLSSISNSLSNAWARIEQHIEPITDALKKGWDRIEDIVKNWDDWSDNFIRNLPTIVYNLIPDSIKDGVKNAIEGIKGAWSSLYSLWDSFSKWIDNAGSWFQEQLLNAKDTISSWIHEVTDPISDWIDWFKREFKGFISDPIGYIKDVVNPIIAPLKKEWNEFKGWVDDKVKGFIDAISSIAHSLTI